MDGNLTAVQPLDLTGIDVHADDVVTGIGQASSGYQTDISGPKNRDTHL